MEQLNHLWTQLLTLGVDFVKRVIAALIIYFIGRYLIKLVDKLLRKVLERRKLDPTVANFLLSLVNVTLLTLLVLSVVGALGIQMTSFAAILASVGVAIGMALSGNLQNFAGGVILLILRPYKVGDYICAAGVEGTVKSIQIFCTELVTPDNKVILIPNNVMSTATLTNYSKEETRRVDFTFGVDYGTDINKVRECLETLIADDERILKEPKHAVYLAELADSSVNTSFRVWVKSADYWSVYFDLNEKVYNAFNERGISFPFPQLTVHQADK